MCYTFPGSEKLMPLCKSLNIKANFAVGSIMMKKGKPDMKMKIMRNPKVNAAIILIITAFYSLVFILTSGHIEFERMLNHANTLNNAFWNAWSAFLMQGNLKYIGYAYLVLAVAIVILSLIR